MQPYLILILTGLEQLLLGAFMFYLPAIERRGIFFGKRTNESPQIPKMTAQWHWAVVVITLACLIGSISGGLWAISSPKLHFRYGIAFWIGFSILHPLALAAIWIIMRYRFRPPAPEAIDMYVRRANLRRPHDPVQNLKRFLALGPLLTIAASIIYLRLQWNQIPEHFPLHWSVVGEVDTWSDKSIRTMALLPILSAGIWVFFFILLKLNMFAHMAPRRKFGFELLFLGLMWAIVPPLCLTNIMLPFANPNTISLILLMHILSPVVVSAVCVLIWLKASSQLSGDSPATPAEINRRDDRYWRFGLYFNPDDPALWVERRFGVGPTPNMAHPQGKAVMLGLLVFVLALIGWIISMVWAT